MVRVARFDAGTLLDLQNDKRATGQAVVVLGLATLSYGLGLTFTGGQGAFPNVLVMVRSVLVWMAWFSLSVLVLALTTFVVGTRLLRGQTSFSGLVRPLFFSTSPGILFLLASVPVPGLPNLIIPAVWAWVLVAGVFAIRRAMSFSIQQSMLAFIIFVPVWILVSGLVLSLLPV